MISWLLEEDGMSGPNICPDAPTEAAARTAEAARAPCRNLLREIMGFLVGAADAGDGTGGIVDVGGGVEVVDALGFFSSMNMSSVTQQ
jgi:hypothetical protein